MNDKRLRLPDFCAGPAVVAIILIVVLTAVVIALARQDDVTALWTDLARTALFLLWTGLGCATALCLLRRRLESLPIPQATAVAIGAIVFVVALVSQATLWLGDSGLLEPLAAQLMFPTRPLRFLLTNVAIGAIVGALALRYFYVIGEWQRNVELQAQARVHALQARIRPHFLYNSMNTIASLTRTDPALAEEAVQDLADLFRASLTERNGGQTLRDEVEIARTYERMERLRLGERLRVDWDIDTLPPGIAVPGLLLQPLLENAIYHGIEPRRDGGLIRIVGRLDDAQVELLVRNPLPEEGRPAHSGNRMAMANIRERLELMYPGRATVEAGEAGGEYVVRLRFPLGAAAGAGP
jgi:two-component system sensor histidine kinase AlgZ